MHGIYFSFEERIGCAEAARPHAGHANPTCILAARLNARGCVSFWRRMHGSAAPSKPGAAAGQKSTPRGFRQSASMHGVCVYHLTAICSRAPTASSQPSRMHFGTDSTCICFPHSGLGVWGHVGPLHGGLGTHKPLRHNPLECISARILNASGPRARVWECEAMLSFYTAIWARTNRFVTNLTNAFRH